MKKIIIIFSVVVLTLTACLILIFKFKDTPKEETTYCVKTAYSYLSKGDVKFDVKIYSNYSESLLLHAKEADVYLHDKKEDNVVSVSVEDVIITNTTIYNDIEYYEYTMTLNVSIDKLKIEECYLSLKFSNKVYIFEIGSFEIVKNTYPESTLKITNLYGVRAMDNLSLSGIVITFTNPTEDKLRIKKVDIGTGYEVFLSRFNKTSVSESVVIDDYLENIDNIPSPLIFEPGETATYILPIVTDKEVFLANTYMLLEINGTTHYFPNFTYIKTNDLQELKDYVIKGIIYEL